jgi:hypothetical protein
MHYAVAGDQRAIADLDPSSEQRAARDYGLVTDPAIVRDMRILHQEVAVTDNRNLALLAAAMDRNALAENVPITYPNATRPAGIGEVLRLISDHRVRMDHIVRAHLSIAEDRRVTDQASARADFDPAFEQAQRPDFDTFAELNLAADYGASMDSR